MTVIVQLLTVFALGAVELWAAIPAGLAFRLPPLVTGMVAVAGALIGMVFILTLGAPVRAWLLRRYGARGDGSPHGLVGGLWSRYGIVGLGLGAPLLLGVLLGTALGVALAVPTRRLIAWMATGVILWGVVFTALAVAGGAVLHL